MIFDVDVKYREDQESMADWGMAGKLMHFSIESDHILNAMWKVCQNFPIKYARDVSEIHIVKTNREVLVTDEPDRIREGDGWKAREKRDIV